MERSLMLIEWRAMVLVKVKKAGGVLAQEGEVLAQRERERGGKHDFSSKRVATYLNTFD
jgi:hypothetical protein